jgi:phage FluMu protein Com
MEKEVTKCRNCGTPLIKRVDSQKYQLETYGYRKILLSNNGNEFTISCPKCKEIATFSTERINLECGYVLTTELEKK